MHVTDKSYQSVNYCIRCGSSLTLEYDREDKLRPHCTSCGWIYYKNPVPAVACIILNSAADKIVVIKRKFEPNAGQWALPSGYIDINQHPEETAIAEMKEETGLDGEIKEYLGFYSGYSPIYEQIISHGFLMKIKGGELQAGDDAVDAYFAQLDKLPPIPFLAHKHYINMIKNR